jgi:uridine phosphorylase
VRQVVGGDALQAVGGIGAVSTGVGAGGASVAINEVARFALVAGGAGINFAHKTICVCAVGAAAGIKILFFDADQTGA